MKKSFARPQPFLSLIVFIIILSVISVACNNTYVPKPEGYFKIDLPEKKYTVFDQPGYPYSFEYPVYANIIKDSSFFW